MKKFWILFAGIVILVTNTASQIPNNGFESLNGWYKGNAILSTDHYPESLGSYSLKLQNQLPLTNHLSYGYVVTGDTSNGCVPSFPIKGHPTKLCGYYKCFPMNNDTMQVGLELFKNGIWIAGAEFITTNTVSNWTSFSIPISTYTEADSATITIAAFYNDTTCGTPYGPFGNSVFYIDNLSFDSLTTVAPTLLKELSIENSSFSISPNPATNFVNLSVHSSNSETMSLTISTINGIKVKSLVINERQKEICISDLTNGIYFVTIKSKSFIKTKRLIIQK